MGINRDSQFKRRKTGGRRVAMNKKRKFLMGRPAAMTKLGEKRIHSVRTMGGNTKYRALRLDAGSFSWGSESFSAKTRVIDVMYNAANAEFVRTKIMTKGAIVQIDATPFRQWYCKQYNKPLGAKKGKAVSEVDAKQLASKKSGAVTRKMAARNSAVEGAIGAQATTGRLLARLTSRPGQSGRADGYILEGKELDFYQRKMKK